MNGYQAGLISHAVKWFLMLALLGVPFYLWDQGHVWGPLTGVLSGVFIYGSTLLYAVSKVLR